MIGTGVFTSLGFQLIELQSAPVLLMLFAEKWVSLTVSSSITAPV